MIFTKWQQQIIDNAKSLTNGELLLAILWSAAGDDYDGEFTDKGLWELFALNEEFMSRLLVAGLLTESEIEKIKQVYGANQ